MSFFGDTQGSFRLFGEPAPRWRRPQLGAIGALIAHFSLGSTEPPLVSIPTGTGKTALALAAPYLVMPPPRRLLVVEPSVALRAQVANEARSLRVLDRIGCLERIDDRPTVIEMAGHTKDWSELEAADIVVALPNSVSPDYYPDNLPPADLFDLIVIDEAHHVVARTWASILDHFEEAQSVLFTATPFRRDGRRLAGRVVYHYPLLSALDDGIYQPVKPHLLQVEATDEKSDVDLRVAERAVELLSFSEHTTSALLIRAATIQRANELASIYRSLNVNVDVLSSQLGQRAKERIIGRLRSGESRAVAVVGMLSEGFDLPRLRIAAYHDKHKSLPATVQLIGRLARVDPSFPQQSELVVAQDADVFPELQGVVRDLYSEDSDWVRVLPGLIDDEVERLVADREFTDNFSAFEGTVDATLLHPLNRCSITEVYEPNWSPFFASGEIPDFLHVGARYGDGTVVYAGVNRDRNAMVVVTRRAHQPRWSRDSRITDVAYDLTVVSFRPAPQTSLPGLLFENSDSPRVQRALRAALDVDHVAKPLDPDLVSRYLDSLERTSVSSVGVRSTGMSGRTGAAYRSYMGRGVDRGLRAADTARSGLGHVMLQSPDGNGTTITVGGATGKGKLWRTHYSSLREYDEWIGQIAERVWFERVGPSGPLLPGVNRGARFEHWPDSVPIAVEFDPALIVGGFKVARGGESPFASLEDVVLTSATDSFAPIEPSDDLQLRASLSGADDDPFWQGSLSIDGTITTTEGDIRVTRGFSIPTDLAELLTAYPPIVHYLNGMMSQGHVVYDSRAAGREFNIERLQHVPWNDVDITAETQDTATKRGGGLRSIHEALEEYLDSQPRRGRRRWIMCNDGSGELADYVVIEDLGRRQVHIEFWHAKYSTGQSPGVRIDDLAVVFTQAVRSRRFLPDRDLWERIRHRLCGDESPPLRMIGGSDDLNHLLVRLGFDSKNKGGSRVSWRRSLTVPSARIGIAQPGLSKSMLAVQRASQPRPASAESVLSLLTAFEDFATAETWEPVVLCSA